MGHYRTDLLRVCGVGSACWGGGPRSDAKVRLGQHGHVSRGAWTVPKNTSSRRAVRSRATLTSIGGSLKQHYIINIRCVTLIGTIILVHLCWEAHGYSG
jgi:hypothetical protein